MWKFQDFYALQILSPKNYHFDHFSSSEFWIFEDFWHFQVWNFSKDQNTTPLKLLKRQFLTSWNQLKLISRKIRVARNVFSEKSQFGCPGLYMLEKCEMFSAKKGYKKKWTFLHNLFKMRKTSSCDVHFFPMGCLEQKKGQSPQQRTLHNNVEHCTV